MRTSVINRFAKNVRSSSVRRGLAAVATTVVLAGGVQVLTAGSAWACEGPYKANNPTVSAEARGRHHDGDPVAAFISPFASTMTTGSSAEIGVEMVNFTGADFDLATPALTLKGSHLRAQDVTVEVMRANGWTKLGVDGGCGGEAVRVDTSSMLQHLSNGHASRAMFRITLAAGAPDGLTSMSVSTAAWGEVSTGHPDTETRTIKVVHPGSGATTPAKPKATKKAAEPAVAKAAAPAAAPAAIPSAAPATTAPAGTPELAQTGASENNTFLAASSAVLLALGAGVLVAVRRLRPQR